MTKKKLNDFLTSWVASLGFVSFFLFFVAPFLHEGLTPFGVCIWEGTLFFLVAVFSCLGFED